MYGKSFKSEIENNTTKTINNKIVFYIFDIVKT